MARVKGPVWKKARRLEFSILETGQELKKRQYAPGQHGPTARRAKLSEYALQLREKQRIRFIYRVTERQFYNTYLKATKIKGVTGHNFLALLEARLDNVVYRLGFGRTRAAARQLVNHGHILVDGKKVDIPSFSVKPGSTIEVKEASKGLDVLKESLSVTLSNVDYVSVDKDNLKGVFVRYPDRNELNMELNESLVVEFYNR